jgi:hypothetical protein
LESISRRPSSREAGQRRRGFHAYRERRETGTKPVAFADAITRAEGSTRNPRSSADGYGNFIDSTWLSVAPKITDTAGLSREQILQLRHDKTIAQRATDYYAAQNSRYLRIRGVEDSPGNLSLAHFLGPEGAAKVLKADPSTPVESLLPAEVIQANREVLRGKSASEVIAWAHKRIGASVNEPPARPDAVPDEGYDYSSPAPYTIETLRPDDVTTNAALMQYKSGGDEAGVTDALKGVEQWNPLLSQQILVWEPNEGGRIVVDGHQRVGLAKRLGGDIELPAIVVREADGITAEQARRSWRFEEHRQRHRNLARQCQGAAGCSRRRQHVAAKRSSGTGQHGPCSPVL